MKTSKQPSISSSNFAPFISVEVLRASDISPVPSLNLKPKSCSPYKKSCWGNSKTEDQKGHKIQNRKIASKVLLGRSKRRNRSVCRDPTPSDIPSDSEIKLAVPLADDVTEEDEEGDANCLCCIVPVVSLKTSLERWLDMMCEMLQMGAHALCWYGGKLCLSEKRTV